MYLKATNCKTVTKITEMTQDSAWNETFVFADKNGIWCKECFPIKEKKV